MYRREVARIHKAFERVINADLYEVVSYLMMHIASLARAVGTDRFGFRCIDHDGKSYDVLFWVSDSEEEFDEQTCSEEEQVCSSKAMDAFIEAWEQVYGRSVDALELRAIYLMGFLHFLARELGFNEFCTDSEWFFSLEVSDAAKM